MSLNGMIYRFSEAFQYGNVWNLILEMFGTQYYTGEFKLILVVYASNFMNLWGKLWPRYYNFCRNLEFQFFEFNRYILLLWAYKFQLWIFSKINEKLLKFIWFPTENVLHWLKYKSRDLIEKLHNGVSLKFPKLNIPFIYSCSLSN